MTGKMFLSVDDVANELSVSKSYAYKLIRKLNEELKSMDYLTVTGRVNSKYFMEKMYYNKNDKKGR